MKSELNNILNKYDKSLIIPSVKSEYKFILCPVGLVGSGKTTVLKPLSEILDLIMVSSDEIRKILKEEYPFYTQEDVFNIENTLIKKYLQIGYSVAIDSDCISLKSLID